MITLTAEQKDALIEISNIGMSKAAKQLSILLNSPIKITIPEISIMDIDEIARSKSFDHTTMYSLVSQKLSADIQGCSALVIRREYANLLTMAVIGKMPEFTPEEANACEQEAMLEIGNIIITTCISIIANMLKQTVHLSLPIYNEDKIVALLTGVSSSENLNKNFIAISTKLDTYNNILSGHLFLIVTEESAMTLLACIKNLIGE
jgi:chemotaxis protein CheC